MNNRLKGRLKSIFLLEAAASAIYDLYTIAPNGKTKMAYLEEAGHLHGVAERLKSAWEKDPIPGVSEYNVES